MTCNEAQGGRSAPNPLPLFHDQHRPCRVLFDTSFPNSLHCRVRLIESLTRDTVSAGPARRAERRRTGGICIRSKEFRPVRTGEFSEPHHSLYSLDHFVCRNRFAAAMAHAFVCAPGHERQARPAAQAGDAFPRPVLRHLRLPGSFGPGHAGRTRPTFLLGRMPRPLSAQRAASGRRMTGAGCTCLP